METDGSGAPHARVRAAVLPVHCVALCVCVLLRVCSSLRACATAVSVSTATGIGAAAPDGIRERSASRQSLESLGNTPQTMLRRIEGTLCFMAFLMPD